MPNIDSVKFIHCYSLSSTYILLSENVSDNNPGLAINLDSNPLTDEVQSLASGISAAALGMQIGQINRELTI